MVRRGARDKEVEMQVEITVKVNGEVVRQQVEQVSGTLEDVEEKIDALSRRWPSWRCRRVSMR